MAEIGGMLAAAVLKAAAVKVAAASVDRIMLQWRFGEDLEDMKDILESIEAVLEDAERRSIQEASVRLWLKRLTRASYDIADMFDEFEVNITRKSSLRKHCTGSNNRCISIFSLRSDSSRSSNSGFYLKSSFQPSVCDSAYSTPSRRLLRRWSAPPTPAGPPPLLHRLLLRAAPPPPAPSHSRRRLLHSCAAASSRRAAASSQPRRHFNPQHLLHPHRPPSPPPAACSNPAGCLVQPPPEDSAAFSSPAGRLVHPRRLSPGASAARSGRPRPPLPSAAPIPLKVLNPFITLAPEVGMAEKMKKVREKLESISDQHQKFSFMAGSISYVQQVIDERATSSKVIEADILGRDREKEKVISLLVNSSTKSEFIVLPIYGIAGIGKTTLAQLIFNDTHFKDYDKAWVYVSQVFDLNKIDYSIISQLRKEQSQLTNTQEPDANASACKKILIVLDDLWESDDFKLDALRHSMQMVGNGRNKVHVIVTTRDAGIAKKIQTTEPHKIEPLSSDLCWTIIKQIVGFEDRDDKERLEDTGKEIAKKCGGVALAARALGYLLRSKNFEGWVSAKDNGLWNMPMGQRYTPQPYDNVLASLKLSYISMLPYLRLCFAYCAIFPKGHKMAKDDLIYQWAALGFIELSDEVFTLQHGEDSINQLLGMGFLQHSKSPLSNWQYDEDVTLFTMHDLVHDLARSIMGDEIRDSSRKCNIGGSNCRYVSLAHCCEPLNSIVTYPEKIRALRVLRSCNIENCASGFAAAKYLRVLDLGECSIQKFSSFIGELKQLRYLNVPGMKDQIIPSCVTKLSKLIYLNLRGSSAVLALPDSIGEMEDLMFLDLSDCSEIRELPNSFGNLKNLVHLDFSKCSKVSGVSKYLENLTRLQYLNLSYCKSIGEVPVALQSLTRLRYLNLSCSSYFVGMSNGNAILSNGDVLGTLTNLEYLNLSLPSTECLFLERLPEALGRFAELKYLNLSGCRQLEELPNSFGKIRNLVHLDLSNCYQVNGLPAALRGLTKLQHLDLSRRCHSHQPTLGGLPEVLRELIELRYLNLSGCVDPHVMVSEGEEVSDHIDSLLNIISTLSNLEHLELSDSLHLCTIPHSFCKLRKLHTLDLTGCRNLESLPEIICDMERLKFVIVKDCPRLDMSTLRINKSSILLPIFMVHVADGQERSNLVLLKDATSPELEIGQLENVISIEEARAIKLGEKQSLVKLTLDWTRGKKRFVEDMDLLEELKPPSSLKEFELRGYNSIGLPTWFLCMANSYLPNLVRVKLAGLSKCNSLPPLGQLPNLKYVYITAMPSIKKIDTGFCGSVMQELLIYNMENLEEWSVAHSDGEDVADEFMFRNLKVLRICRCPKLMVKPCPPRVNGTWHIIGSDGPLLQWGDSSVDPVSSSSSASVACLKVTSCNAPMHRWKLLHHLSGLSKLKLEYCIDLSCSSSEILGVLCSLRKLTLKSCGNITFTSLPQWLEELTSLQELKIKGCRNLSKLPENIRFLRSLRSLSLRGCWGIRALPESMGDLVCLKNLNIDSCEGIVYLPKSMQRLTSLERLTISHCPALEQWCKLEENKERIGHIKQISFSRDATKSRA